MMKKNNKNIIPYILISIPLLFIGVYNAFKKFTQTKDTSFWSKIKYFVPSEFDEKSSTGKGTGKKYMKRELVEKLDKSRGLAGFPFLINSGYRSPLYNERVGGVKDSEHIYGMAADIRFKGYNEYSKLSKSLKAVGIKRLGYYINPKTNVGFIHAGVSKTHPQTSWHKVFNGKQYASVSSLNDVTKHIS